jgi:hypothetical protein
MSSPAQDYGSIDLMERGTMEWNGGTMEWNGGTVEWNGGIVEWWNGAALYARMRITKVPIASIANRATTKVLLVLVGSTYYYAFFSSTTLHGYGPQ